MREASNQKLNGQHKNFKGYGGIEDLERYVAFELGTGWEQKKSKNIKGILNFKQTIFGPDNLNNCTLASITRTMKYYSDLGFQKIPSVVHEIYAAVREIGVKHGYDPEKSGILRDLFIYTPFEIKTMVRDTWKRFGYESSKSNNIYFRRLKTIKNSIDDMNPALLNIAWGDYKGHTVTVTGYRVFSSSREHCDDRTFVQVYDGWSEDIRYIDWKKFGITPASVTRII